MGCSQHDLVMDYITAPNIQGYQNGALILGTIHIMAIILLYCQMRGWEGSTGQELVSIIFRRVIIMMMRIMLVILLRTTTSILIFINCNRKRLVLWSDFSFSGPCALVWHAGLYISTSLKSPCVSPIYP